MPTSPVALSLALALAITMTSRAAEAQVCSGAAPFSSGHFRIGVGMGNTTAGLGSADGQPAFGAQLAYRPANGPFGSVGASIALYTGGTTRFVREALAATTVDDAMASIVTMTGGYGISATTSGRIPICPIVGFSRQSGPGLWLRCPHGTMPGTGHG